MMFRISRRYIIRPTSRHRGNRRGGFTLTELLLVIAMMVLLMTLSLPSINALRKNSARPAALNIINAALQGARSYAILNGVTTAARFQPNGKIFFVYRIDTQDVIDIKAASWNSPTLNIDPYPEDTGVASTNEPNDDLIIYLPVVDREPMQLPKEYAVADNSSWASGYGFEEPFYICYRPDGTVAVDQDIWVGLTTRDGLPVNPDVNSDPSLPPTPPAWDASDFAGLAAFTYLKWKGFADDASEVADQGDRKIARFYFVATDPDPDLQAKINDADHYGGFADGSGPIPTKSSTHLALFSTPDEWHKVEIFSNGPEPTKATLAEDILNDSSIFREEININHYTGRVIGR